MTTTKNLHLYTDGACKNNGKANATGGWAYVLFSPEENKILLQKAKKVENTTNQRMELTAAIEALYSLESFLGYDKFTVYSDSAYLINCYNQNWWQGWLRNGWINSKKEPVANKELWEKLIPFFKNPNFDFVKVKGHAGHFLNEKVDELAQNAARGNK